MNQRMRVVAVALLLLVAAALGARTCGKSQPQLAVKANSLEEAVAYVMGQQIRDSVEASGPIVLIPVPGLDELGLSMNKRTRAAFDRGLGARARDVVEIDLEQGRSREEFLTVAGKVYDGRWAAELAAWTQAHPDAVAVANLNPLPQDATPAALADLPPVFTLFPMLNETEAQAAVARLGLRMAFLPKDTLARPGAVPREGSPQQLFDAAYQVLTPEGAGGEGNQ